mgnify:FL=1
MGDNKQEFFELVQGLGVEDWNVKINADWTLKEVVSHFIGWEEEFAVSLLDSWQNNATPWFLKTKNFDEFNKKSVKKYEKYSPQQLIERWRFVMRVFDSEIDDIGIGRIKAKGKLFDWVFEDGIYEKYLEKVKKVIKVSKEV